MYNSYKLIQNITKKKSKKGHLNNHTLKSYYKPSINKYVDNKVRSLLNKSLHSMNRKIKKKPYDIFGCKTALFKSTMRSLVSNDAIKRDKTRKKQKYKVSYNQLIKNLKIKINNKCVSAFSLEAQRAMIHNIQFTNHLNPSKVISPVQHVANCWFNVFFMVFFISDKGRLFFKFFRLLMIIGKKSNGNKINKQLHFAFLLLNLCIESSYNLYPSSKNFAKKINTNHLILYINQSIQEGGSLVYNIHDAGNPYSYYRNIMNYLDVNDLNILKIHNSSFIYQTLDRQMHHNRKLPHIIVLECKDNDKKDAIIKMELNNQNIKYELDSACIIDTKGNHFCGLLHINNIEYGFDGSSSKRLEPFKWVSLLNKNKNWTFKGTNRDVSLSDYCEWNFTKSYCLLFYYRV